MDTQTVLAQAGIADILASLYLNFPDPEKAAAFRTVAEDMAESLGLKPPDLSISVELADLQADYNELFLVPVSGRYLPPFESAQRARRLWGPITHQVADFYASVGFDPASLHMAEPWQRLDAPDHVGIELACLSALLYAYAETPSSDLARAIDFFTREHIRHWLPHYGDAVAQNAKTAFYRALGALTQALGD